MGAKARAVSEVVQLEDAEVTGGSTPRTHTQYQFEQEHTGVDNRTEGADAGSIPLAGCSPLGCTPRKGGTSGPVVVGIHRS